MTNVFVYGTLMNPDRCSAILGHEVEFIDDAHINNFRMDDWSGYRIIRPGNDQIQGRIITGLDADDLELLDGYEGIPYTPYRRSEVVAMASGERIVCTVYTGDMNED